MAGWTRSSSPAASASPRRPSGRARWPGWSSSGSAVNPGQNEAARGDAEHLRTRLARRRRRRDRPGGPGDRPPGGEPARLIRARRPMGGIRSPATGPALDPLSCAGFRSRTISRGDQRCAAWTGSSGGSSGCGGHGRGRGRSGRRRDPSSSSSRCSGRDPRAAAVLQVAAHQPGGRDRGGDSRAAGRQPDRRGDRPAGLPGGPVPDRAGVAGSLDVHAHSDGEHVGVLRQLRRGGGGRSGAAAARTAGLPPELDRDGDGVACDAAPTSSAAPSVTPSRPGPTVSSPTPDPTPDPTPTGTVTPTLTPSPVAADPSSAA